MRIGRNDPCPCGSGKKYKRCCLSTSTQETESPDLLVWRRVRRALEGFPPLMLKFIEEVYGPVAAAEAWTELNGSEDEESTGIDPESPHVPVFLPWFFHVWEPDVDTAVEDESLHDRSPTAEFLRRRGNRIEPVLRRYLEACLQSPFSFHEVVDVQRGQGLRARDVLTGEERQVLERSGSETMHRGDILFAQLVETDGIVMLEGSSPVLLPPIDKIEIIELRKRVMHSPGTQSPRERLRDFDMEIFDLYFALADRILNPVLPEVRNTDDEFVVPHKVVFDIESARAAFDALKHLSLTESEEELLASAKLDPAGGLERVHIVWSKAKNSMHASWDNTTLGSIDIQEGRLVGEVNSAERAAELKRIVEQALGTSARHRATEIQSLESALAQSDERRNEHPFSAARADDEQRKLDELPEVQAQIERFTAAHYDAWVTMKLPALGGRTPLEAVADPDGREMVEALVMDLERHHGRGGPSVDTAVLHRLRERLGLAPSNG